jgi:hypothetical protein
MYLYMITAVRRKLEVYINDLLLRRILTQKIGQSHYQATLPPHQESPAPVQQEAGQYPQPVWTLRRKQNLLSMQRVAPRYLRRPACKLGCLNNLLRRD